MNNSHIEIVISLVAFALFVIGLFYRLSKPQKANIKCFGPFFHDWPKWSEPTEEEWIHKRVLHGIVMSEEKYVRSVQQRTCSKCGMVQKRYLKTTEGF